MGASGTRGVRWWALGGRSGRSKFWRGVATRECGGRSGRSVGVVGASGTMVHGGTTKWVMYIYIQWVATAKCEEQNLVYNVIYSATAREAGEGRREQRVVSAGAGYLLWCCKCMQGARVYIYWARVPFHRRRRWAAAEVFAGKMQVAVGRGSGR